NYSTLLANGFSRNYVVRQVVNLTGLQHDSRLERRILGSSTLHLSKSQQVTQLYVAILGRQPTSRELRAGVSQLSRSGGSTRLIISLLSTTEYFNAAFAKGSAGGVASTS